MFCYHCLLSASSVLDTSGFGIWQYTLWHKVSSLLSRAALWVSAYEICNIFLLFIRVYSMAKDIFYTNIKTVRDPLFVYKCFLTATGLFNIRMFWLYSASEARVMYKLCCDEWWITRRSHEDSQSPLPGFVDAMKMMYWVPKRSVLSLRNTGCVWFLLCVFQSAEEENLLHLQLDLVVLWKPGLWLSLCMFSWCYRGQKSLYCFEQLFFMQTIWKSSWEVDVGRNKFQSLGTEAQEAELIGKLACLHTCRQAWFFFYFVFFFSWFIPLVGNLDVLKSDCEWNDAIMPLALLNSLPLCVFYL